MDIEWVIFHLIHNDDDFDTVSLDIDYYDNDVWYRLLTSLSRNTVLTEIRLIRAESPQSRIRTIQELSDLYEAIQQIPTTLTNLEFLGGFTGDDLDLVAAYDLFEDHPTITKLQLVVSNGTLSRRVLQSISTITNLDEIQIEISHDNFDIGVLCTSNTLTMLRIDTYGQSKLDDGCVLGLAESLSSNTTRLQVLDMDCTITAKGLSYLSNVLKNNTCLKKLKLAIIKQQHGNDDDNNDKELSFLIDFIDSLQDNNTLEYFHNYRLPAWRSKNDAPLSAILQREIVLLEKNTTLRYFTLVFQPILDHEVHETNNNHILQKEIYFTLNKGGRGRLLGNNNNNNIISKRDWIDVIANPLTVDNINCLFYYISYNPLLCKCDDAVVADDCGLRQGCDNDDESVKDTKPSPTKHKVQKSDDDDDSVAAASAVPSAASVPGAAVVPNGIICNKRMTVLSKTNPSYEEASLKEVTDDTCIEQQHVQKKIRCS